MGQRMRVRYIEKTREWLQGLEISLHVIEILPVPRGMTEPSHDLLVGRNDRSVNFSYQRTYVSLNEVVVNGITSYAYAIMLTIVMMASHMVPRSIAPWLKYFQSKLRVTGYWKSCIFFRILKNV